MHRVRALTPLQWCYNERDGVSNHWCLNCSTFCTDADQRKHQSWESLVFLRGIHRWLVDSPHKDQWRSALMFSLIWWPGDSPHKGSLMQKMFSFDDVIMHWPLVDVAVILNCSQVNATEACWWDVDIGSGNGLVPSGNKPLPEPILTQISVAIWHLQAT